MGTSKKSSKVSSISSKSSTGRSKKVKSGGKTTPKFYTTMPSEVHDEPWISVERKKGKYPEPTENSGKWLVYVWNHNIDLVWEMISSATERGLLGFESKASTAMPSPLAPKENLGVICVYTYDFTDKEDVMRIREELRKIGVKNKIPYKADKTTRALQYGFNTKGRVSLYYE